MRSLPLWRVQFVALAVIWGSSFVCIKVLGEVLAPLHVALARSLVGALTLTAILRFRGERLPAWGPVWGHLMLVALLMNIVPFTLFAYGEQHVSSILAGLWNATTPLLTLVVVLLVLRDEEPDRWKIRGLLLGFVGVALLLGPWNGLSDDALLGNLACVAAATCYAFGVPVTRRYLSGRSESGTSIAAGQLLLATLGLAVLAPLGSAPAGTFGGEEVASLLVLGALGSGVAYALTHAIVRAVGATTFSTVTYVIPLISTGLGIALLAEPLSWNEPVGAAIVLASVWLAQRGVRGATQVMRQEAVIAEPA